MFKLPFGYLPGHWGLKGKTREIAKAEYELSGSELELKLLHLNDNLSPTAKEKRRLEILHKYGKLTEKDYLHKQIGLIEDDLEREMAQLEFDRRHNGLSDHAYGKKLATLKKEPWVKVLSMEFGVGSPTEGSFELDWNDYFVESLKKEGYKGADGEAIVNIWFMEVCRNVAMEEFSGTGDFESDSQANIDTMKRWQTQTNQESKGRRGYT